MAFYRKVPVVIQAFQITRETREDNCNWPNWLNEAWGKNTTEVGAVFPSEFPDSNGTDQLAIRTLEGVMAVGWDDFIIRGIQGELYARKPDIFKETYEWVSNK